MTALAQACDYFELSRDARLSSQYIFDLPRQAKTFVGLGCHKRIRYQADGFHIEGQGQTTRLPPVPDPLPAMRALLDPGFPSFWMVSPDLARHAHDPELPLIICLQPSMEIQLCGFEMPVAAPPRGDGAAAQGWETESDQAFLGRLKSAIEILQAYPQGKMIITRPYQRPIGGRDPFQLFKRFARTESHAACNHLLKVDDAVFSLGCSPENVFEVHDGRLSFDVVAGTRGVSPDPAVDARWLAALQADPKERREHLMAFDRYKARIETLIRPGSLVVEHLLQVLQLGNVRHLYSRLSGEMGPDLSWATLLAASFPALSSYPDALQPLADNASQPLRFYGGILGRVSADQRQAAFYLNLRAALARKDVLFTQGGVGVIAESEPEKELLEVKNKLSGLMKAVAGWEARPEVA